MHYLSTRGQGSGEQGADRSGAKRLGFEHVLLAGLAHDGGLYLPDAWPTLMPKAIAAMSGKSFADIAVEVIAPFVGRSLSRAELKAHADAAYAGFGHPAVTPLVEIDTNRWVLELFHGPTLAFKDVAMQLLARLMDHALAKRGQRTTIVGATSGDTGGAAIEAFRGSKRCDVVILFPEGRVSDVQRRMMTTPTEANVHAVAVKGNFDDCQALVKAMFNDHAFRDRVQLSGVNSINWARIVAQVTYYFAAGVALGSPHRPVSFVVPTGNFGDIFAGYVAKCMGLPVADLVIASNANDILPRTLDSGVYEMRGVTATTSPSMDIQISSNFERYLFEAANRNAAVIRGLMGSLAQGGRFELGKLHTRLKRDFKAAAASEKAVADCIRRVRKESGYLLDPHTACGVVAAEKTLQNRAIPQAVLATAHPAKFPDAIRDITGEHVGLPPRLKNLMTAKERFDVLPGDAAKVKAYVEAVSRAAGVKSK